MNFDDKKGNLVYEDFKMVIVILKEVTLNINNGVFFSSWGGREVEVSSSTTQKMRNISH